MRPSLPHALYTLRPWRLPLVLLGLISLATLNPLWAEGIAPRELNQVTLRSEAGAPGMPDASPETLTLTLQGGQPLPYTATRTDNRYELLLDHTVLSPALKQHPMVHDTQGRWVAQIVPVEGNRVKIVVPNVLAQQQRVQVVQQPGSSAFPIASPPDTAPQQTAFPNLATFWTKPLPQPSAIQKQQQAQRLKQRQHLNTAVATSVMGLSPVAHMPQPTDGTASFPAFKTWTPRNSVAALPLMPQATGGPVTPANISQPADLTGEDASSDTSSEVLTEDPTAAVALDDASSQEPSLSHVVLNQLRRLQWRVSQIPKVVFFFPLMFIAALSLLTLAVGLLIMRLVFRPPAFLEPAAAIGAEAISPTQPLGPPSLQRLPRASEPTISPQFSAAQSIPHSASTMADTQPANAMPTSPRHQLLATAPTTASPTRYRTVLKGQTRLQRLAQRLADRLTPTPPASSPITPTPTKTPLPTLRIRV